MSLYQHAVLTILSLICGGGLVAFAWLEHARDERRRRERMTELLTMTRAWLTESGAVLYDRRAYNLRVGIDQEFRREGVDA